jgi:hypothetical protein
MCTRKFHYGLHEVNQRECPTFVGWRVQSVSPLLERYRDENPTKHCLELSGALLKPSSLWPHCHQFSWLARRWWRGRRPRPRPTATDPARSRRRCGPCYWMPRWVWCRFGMWLGANLLRTASARMLKWSCVALRDTSSLLRYLRLQHRSECCLYGSLQVGLLRGLLHGCRCGSIATFPTIHFMHNDFPSQNRFEESLKIPRRILKNWGKAKDFLGALFYKGFLRISLKWHP